MPNQGEEEEKRRISIQEAFPALRDENVAEAEARLERYVRLVYRIYESIRENLVEYERFKKLLNDSHSSSPE